MKKRIVVIPVILAALAFALLSVGGSLYTTVPEGHAGVVIRLGQAMDTVLEPGFHWKSPLSSIVLMDTRWQKYETKTSAFSKDIQQVDVIVSMSYQMNSSSAVKMYSTVGVDYADKIMRPRLLDALKSTFAKYSAEELISNRERISTEVLELLTHQLAFYDLTVREIAIEDIDFTDAFTDAIEAKQVATQRKLQTETEQEQQTLVAEAEANRAKIQAQAQAERTRIEAQAQADAVRIAAEAEAYRLEMEGKNITEMSIRKAAVEKWDGELPVIAGGDGTPIVDMRGLLEGDH